MKHLFVINPKSFPDKREMQKFISSAEEILGETQPTSISLYPRYAISKVNDFLGEAHGEQVRVYAVGGDGIFFDCLNGVLRHPEHELTSVPYGNANDFLRAFSFENVPLFRDIKLLSESPSVPTDVFRCGENYCISIASLGLEGSAVLVTDKMAQRLSKMPFLRKLIPTLYTLGAVVVLFNKKLRSQYYNVTIDGKDYSGEYIDINIGNSFGNGGKNASNPYAVPNDGFLDVVFIKKMPLIKCLISVGAFTRGEFEKFSGSFFHVRFKKLYAASEEPIRICADGEAFYTSELSVEIYPKAVRIIAPEGVTYKPFKEYRTW
jgi:diacylglycerol kinase family enzyme